MDDHGLHSEPTVSQSWTLSALTIAFLVWCGWRNSRAANKTSSFKRSPEGFKKYSGVRPAILPGRRLSAWRFRDSHSARFPLRSIIRWYFVAFSSVLAAVLLSWATLLFSGKVTLIFFMVAVVMSAGRGVFSGILATVLSVCAIAAMFKEHLAIPFAGGSMLTLFALAAIATNIVFYKLHDKNLQLTRTNAKLKEAKAVIDAVNQRLLDHAASLAEANAQLAERQVALSDAHEQLRQLGSRLTNNMQEPLRNISSTTAALAQYSAASSEATFVHTSELIRREVQTMDMLVAEFAQGYQANSSRN